MAKKIKHTGLGYNETIRKAIQTIALHGVVNPNTKSTYGNGRVIGYVCKINDEGELAGTVDVQEYVEYDTEVEPTVREGYHQGVLLSAIQESSTGMVVVPKLYSEVVITRDSSTNMEFVSMVSHVDLVQIDSFEKITVGVKEREEYKEEDDDIDIKDLEATGVYSNTTYLKDSVTTEVKGEKATISNVVGDDKSSTTITQDSINMKHDKATVDLKDSEATVAMGGSKVKVTDGVVYVGDDGSVDDAVLGVELANILSEFLGYFGQFLTPTQLGPQAPVNVASFMSLKAKIDAYKGAHSGFLTKKVQIQK